MKFLPLKNLKNGFTIIETLVAVAILMIAIAGPLTVAQKGLMSALYAHDQLTAAYLAQDALEYLKNVRDNNLIAGAFWLRNFAGCTKDTPCSVDTISGSPSSATASGAGIASCPIVSDCFLYSSSQGFGMSSTGATKSQYTRIFYLIPSANNTTTEGPGEVKLAVRIAWKRGTIDNVVTYENQMFNIVK